MKPAATLFASRTLVIGTLVLWAAASDALAQAPTPPTADDSVEEIYIARSLRESRDSPTEFCEPARIGFEGTRVEDRYSFWSTEVRGSDGRVTDAKVRFIGVLQACFGPLPDSEGSFFYSEGALGTVSFTGRGECVNSLRGFPEEGISATRCFLELSDLPSPYIGGHLTTNTLGSQATLGDRSDPPGYTQPSIATIRLWRRR